MQKENEQNTEEVTPSPHADEAPPEAASPGSGEESAPNEEEVDTEQEAKAATVIQSNFRGYKERKRLQEEGQIPVKEKKEADPQPQAEEEPLSEDKTAQESNTTQEEPEKDKPTEGSSERQNGEEEKNEEVQDAQAKTKDEEKEKDAFESFSKNVSRKLLQTGEHLEGHQMIRASYQESVYI